MMRSSLHGWLLAFGAFAASWGSHASAADNTTLFTCETGDKEIVRYFYKSESIANIAEQIKTFRMQIGQDRNPQAPLYEVDMWLLDASGAPIGRKLSPLKRVALVQDTAGETTAITYSPTRSNGAQNSAPFHLLIDAGGAGKLSFIQINAGRNASFAKNFSLSCTPADNDVQIPVPLSLQEMSPSDQVAVLNALQRKRPTIGIFPRSGQPLTLPVGAVANAEELMKEFVRSASFDEAFVRRKAFARDGTVEILAANGRCNTVKIRGLRAIRDFSGTTLAHSVSMACREPAFKLTRTIQRRGANGVITLVTQVDFYALVLDRAYVTSHAVLPAKDPFLLSKITRDEADEE